MLKLRILLLIGITAMVAACAHASRRESVSDLTAPTLTRASAADSAVYDVVLQHLAREYAQPGGIILVQSPTMELCDPASLIYFLDCIRDQNYATLESRWANGSWVFAAFISDSTRRQLAESFRMNSNTPHLLRGLNPSMFVAGPRKEVLQSMQPYPRTIVLARAAYSTNDYAYVYAVFGRQRFGAGLIFLLRKDGSTWQILSTEGVWVT